MSSLPQVLKLLQTLSTKELTEVRQRLDFLLPKKASSPANNDDWLLLGLTNELQKRGLLSGKYHNLALPKDYITKSEEVRAFLLKGYKNERPTPAERLALGQLAGFVLVAYLAKLNLPVGPKILLVNIDKIPVALEDSFPGYWGAQALGRCIGR